MNELWLPTREIEVIYRIPTPILHTEMCEDEVSFYIGLAEQMTDPNQAKDVLNDALSSSQVDEAIAETEEGTTIIIRSTDDDDDDDDDDVTEVNRLY